MSTTHRIEDSQLLDGPATFVVMQEIVNERVRQDVKWGQQNPVDGTGTVNDLRFAEAARALTDYYAKRGGATWKMILDEEVREAFAESDPILLRAELSQVAAVAAAWMEALDRRAK